MMGIVYQPRCGFTDLRIEEADRNEHHGYGTNDDLIDGLRYVLNFQPWKWDDDLH